MLAKLIEQSDVGEEKPVVLSLLPPGPLAQRIIDCGVEVHSLGMRRGMVGPLAMIRLARLVRSIRPHLVHGWMYHGNLAASFARAVLPSRVPLIWNIRHSVPDPKLESRQMRMILRLSAKISGRPDAIIYNAEVSRRQHVALGYDDTRSVVIPNGFDTEKFTIDRQARECARLVFGFADDVLRLACVARLHPMKDQARLIRAVALARESDCDIHLALVGNGLADPPPELAGLIEANIPSERVTTLGARSDVSDWIGGLDVVAVPSAWGEAFPNVIGEALACGVPVITTDIGDSASIVGRHGIVVPPGDTQAMANAIVSLASMSPGKRARMGEAGRKRIVENFSISRIAARYRDLYQSYVASFG